MAKKQVVSYSYTCDVCGDTIPESDSQGSTRKVSWDGTEYVVDVCLTHASLLSDVLAQLRSFVDAGHRGGSRRGRRPASNAATASPRTPRSRPAATANSSSPSGPKRGDLPIIRSWAQANGLSVGDRGRIPAAVIEAYDAAQGAPAASPAPAPEATSAPASAPVAAATKRRPRKSASATASADGTTPQAGTRKRAPRKAAAAR
jgi:hypothetical protein